MPMNYLSTNLMNEFPYGIISLTINILNACKLFRCNLVAQDNEICCILSGFSKFYEFLRAKQNINKRLYYFKIHWESLLIFLCKISQIVKFLMDYLEEHRILLSMLNPHNSNFFFREINASFSYIFLLFETSHTFNTFEEGAIVAVLSLFLF